MWVEIKSKYIVNLIGYLIMKLDFVIQVNS